MITTSDHIHFIAPTLDNNHMFNRWRIRYRFIGGRLESEHISTAIPTIGSNQNFCFSIIDAIS